jgi:hypothetical protein
MGNKQTEANKRWRDKNKEKAAYQNVRSRTRGFIRNKATKDDLIELRALIDEVLKEKE